MRLAKVAASGLEMMSQRVSEREKLRELTLEQFVLYTARDSRTFDEISPLNGTQDRHNR